MSTADTNDSLFMLDETPELRAAADRLCADAELVSDNYGISNKDKWDCVRRVFTCSDCTLFTPMDYGAVYAEDDAVKCEAAGFLADIRAQYLGRLLHSDQTLHAGVHILYLLNRQWTTKFRERVALHHLSNVTKGMRLT